MTSSNGNIFRVTGHLCGEFTVHQWRRALIISLICAWINGWVNIREAGDLKWKNQVVTEVPRDTGGALNSLSLRQKGRHFSDDIFKGIFLSDNIWISINISRNVVPKGLINNIPALVQIMAHHRPGDKPLSETMMVRLPKHICVTRPQWVKGKFLFVYVACGWCYIRGCNCMWPSEPQWRLSWYLSSLISSLLNVFVWYCFT